MPISKETGIPKGSIYQYFGTKKDIRTLAKDLTKILKSGLRD